MPASLAQREPSLRLTQCAVPEGLPATLAESRWQAALGTSRETATINLSDFFEPGIAV
jgi:hypothetical protein